MLLPYVFANPTTDPAPNTSAPSRVWAAPARELVYTLEVSSTGPASATTTIQAWILVDDAALWARRGDPVVAAVGADGTPACFTVCNVPAGARVFVQVTAVSGAPTSLRAGFLGVVP